MVTNYKKTRKYKKFKKDKRKERSLKRKLLNERRYAKKQRLAEFAAKLKKDTPRSELWFQPLFEQYKSISDQFNEPFNGYIPDVLNKEFKYILEVDGSIHDLERIKKKDRKKEKRYHSLGYIVLRIKAYDFNSFENAMRIICKLKGIVFKPSDTYVEIKLDKKGTVSRPPKTILRKANR